MIAKKWCAYCLDFTEHESLNGLAAWRCFGCSHFHPGKEQQ